MAFKFYVIIGLALSLVFWRIIHQWTFRKLYKHIPHRRLFLLDKLSYYSILITFFIISLNMIGVLLSDILATAGILTLTVGFAAKTSVSHLISGFILLGTKLIQRGDLIEVGPYTGIIEDIDIFATHLRTFDNVLISLPNEKLLNEYVSNYSQYPIRRISCDKILSTKDLNESLLNDLKSRLQEISSLMIEPAPLIVLSDSPGRGVLLSARAWCESNNFITARNDLLLEVSAYLREKKINSDAELLVRHDPHFKADSLD